MPIDILQDDKIMIRIGRVCSVGMDLEILYFLDDSAPIPHFHEGKLSDEQCSQLINALNQVEHFDTCTNWEYLLHAGIKTIPTMK